MDRSTFPVRLLSRDARDRARFCASVFCEGDQLLRRPVCSLAALPCGGGAHAAAPVGVQRPLRGAEANGRHEGGEPAAAGVGAAGPGHTARAALQMGARTSHGGEGSLLGELTARNAQNLGQSRCSVVAIAHGKRRASQHLGCLHPLRAAPWPRAGPSPPPRADLVQREGGGRDASPGTGKATTTTWPQGYHVAP